MVVCYRMKEPVHHEDSSCRLCVAKAGRGDVEPTRTTACNSNRGEPVEWRRMPVLIASLVRGRGIVALADQMMVSLSNFLGGIILVRALGLSEFGKYTIAYAFLLYANSLQMSFIASPMLSLAPLMEAKQKRQFVEGMLTIQILASFLLSLAFAIAGSVSSIFTAFFPLRTALAFACCVGTFQLQDWLRRYYFLCHKEKLALVSDFISYVVQLVLLFSLWRFHGLTLLRAFLAICATSVLGFAMGPITDRLRPTMGNLRNTWTQCKVLSRDMIFANQVRWFGTQGILLIGTAILGTAMTGGLRAAQNLAGPLLVFVLSLENVVPIRVAEELKSRGPIGAHRFICRAIFAGVAAAGFLIVPIAVFGRPLLIHIYGPALAPFYPPMLLTMLSVVLAGINSMWLYLYRGLKDSRAILFIAILSTVGCVATVYWFAHMWQAIGIVLATMSGQVMALGYSILHWRASREKLLLDQQLTTSPGSNGAVVVS
jgi:O-antigen/teichoic acid export membrane protein